MPHQDNLTPMYRQWAAAKRDYPDVLLLFRMGDFYEMFDQDARTGAEVLGLTLTSRKASGDQRIAMCGVPHHALDRYLRRLVAAGYRAAICEQIEDPRLAKGLVKRKVTRVVTPGTLLEDELLEGQEHNFLLSLAVEGERAGIAVVDVSTGDFLVTEVPCRAAAEGPLPAGDALAGPPPLPNMVANPAEGNRLALVAEEIARLQPVEIVVPAELSTEPAIVAAAARAGGAHITALPAGDFEFRSAPQQLMEFFGVTTLSGFGCEQMPAAQQAAAQAVRYLQRNRLDALPRLTGISTYSTEQFMVIDAATRRNLELVQTLRAGSREGSLLGLLDRTLTPMGARLLRQWLLQPLLDIAAINARLDAVEALVKDEMTASALEAALRGVRDLERLINRTTAGTANARDLAALGASLGRLPQVRAALEDAAMRSVGGTHAPNHRPSAQSVTVGSCAGNREQGNTDAAAQTPGGGVPAPESFPLPPLRDDLQDVADLITCAIADQPPAVLTEGGIIRDGYSEELDQLRAAMAHGREWIASLQDKERARTGIESLRIGFNKVFGYYIEVTKPNLRLVPADYQRKQTLVNAERFITPELKEMEEKILGAEEKAQELEYELFRRVRQRVADQAERVLAAAGVVAQLDVFLALARVAVECNYTRPEVNDGDAIEILEGRHPVVERTHGAEAFVPNDAHLSCSQDQLLIVTGPNMAGKSTYLRQVALICLLAQMGSFVPARRARIGVVDRIFTRVGASDDLATGQSTFMVEMTETANILHNATPRSLVILDEIGRGTSTFDGLALAWAVAEHLVNRIGAKTLFATHYHHLNELTAVLPRVRNVRVAVKEQGDDIVFLRKIVAGGADRSYGIQVARLAGLPLEVIERAKTVLHSLEQEDLGKSVAPSRQAARAVAPTVQLTLFEAEPDPIVEQLKRLELDTLTPVEALIRLKDLQDQARKR